MPAISALKATVLAAFAAAAFFAFSQQAFAANTVSSAVYLDTNGNGTVDTVRWTMDENVTACTYEAGDWTVNTASEMNLVITGISCTGSNTILNIAVTADSNETGATTAPVISYANAGTAGSVTLTSGAMTAKNSQSTTDNAAPVVVSTTPNNSQAGILKSASVVLVFSEAMDLTFAEGTEYSITPDPGSFAAVAWSAGNTTATLNPADLNCGTQYTFTTDENEVDASAGSTTGLLTTGPVTGTFIFNTINCGENTSAITIPSVINDFAYEGAVCTSENTYSFSLSGSNIDAYMFAADMYFANTDWTVKDIEGSTTLQATLPAGSTTAYAVVKSDSGSVSNIYSFALDEWTDACEQNDEELPANEESANDDDDVVPVAGVEPGDVIRSSSSTAVYYVTETYGRRVFMNEATYFTWFDSFDEVHSVSEATLAALPLQGVMLPKAGVVLVKIQSSPVVYFLDNGSEDFVPDLREIRDEETAISLFGANWADYVIDVEPTFFTKFNMGLDVEMDEELDSDMKKRVDLHE